MAKQVQPQTPEEKQYQETVTRIAGNIASLAKAVNAMLGGPLKRRALIILLAQSSGESQRAVEAIIKALETMGDDWLNK